MSFDANAQLCWDPNDFRNLDGRLRSSDHRVGDVAQIANELAAISPRASKEVTITDFFMAALIKESPSGKNANNNTIEALLDRLNLLTDFKRHIVNEYNLGKNIVKIEDNQIVLVEKSKLAENLEANLENVGISPEMKTLFNEAEQARISENTRRGAYDGSPFSNSFKGLEHFFLGAMKMKENTVSDFLTTEIAATGLLGMFSRLRPAKRLDAKIGTVNKTISEIRGEADRFGVFSKTAYEDYALGNGKSFYSQKGNTTEPPHFLNDMVLRMIKGEYGPVHVRADLVRQLVDILSSRNKNSVEINSEFDGVGKRHVVLSLVKILADIQVNGRQSEYYEILPREFHDIKLYEADLTAYLGAGNDTQYRGATEKSITELINFTEGLNGNAIVVFNEMSGVYNLGATGGGQGQGGGSQGLGHQLVPHISRAVNNPERGLRVIAVTNKITGANEVSNTGWKRYLERMTIREPDQNQTRDIAQVHFDRIVQDNPRIERESLNEIFEYAYQVAQRNPNLGDKMEAVFRIYNEIELQLKDTGGRATEKHVLIAAVKILKAPTVEGGRYIPAEMQESIESLESRLNNVIQGRGQLVNTVVNSIQNGLFKSSRIVNDVVRPEARSVTILVGPSGTLKTSIVEALSSRLGLEFDVIAGSQASVHSLHAIAKKVREGNPSRIVYINEANLAAQRGIFEVLEAMIDGTGIIDQSTGKKTTFENVHFVLDANIRNAEVIAQKYGFSETIPEALIRELDGIRNAKESLSKITEMKEQGEATYRDSNGENSTVTISQHPHGVVKFTREGRRLYNEAVRAELGGREAFMGRAGEPIAVGYLSKEAYKSAVDFEVKQINDQYKVSYNGSELIITDQAKDFIAEKATQEGMETGARFIKTYITNVLSNRISQEVWTQSRTYRKDGLFVGKFEAVMDVAQNGRGIEVNLEPVKTASDY